ncbi:MAG TPA: cob(I)yrinic acid a,c-diamide adenosyltransferase [Lachnospiraceae bacterium]
MQNKGLIHIYCGNGKGKTTAALGLSLRAAAFGFPVLLYQFMKDNTSSERLLLKELPNFTVIDGLNREKFSFQMSAEEKEDRKDYYEEQFQKLLDIVSQQNIKVLFLDEIIYTIRAGLFSENLLIDFLKNKPENLEVILTGQEPSRELIAMADYVSEIKKIKHPFDKGIAARQGIEK